MRDFVLENEDVHSIVKDMYTRVCDNIVDAHTSADKNAEVNVKALIKSMVMLGMDEESVQESMFTGLTPAKTKEKCLEVAWNAYDDKIADIRAQFMPVERRIVLRTIDRNWIEHIDTMDKLRNGIHLRSYAQGNPLQQYISEGYELYDAMMDSISREIVFYTSKIKVERKEA